MPKRSLVPLVLALIALVALVPGATRASDHADPIVAPDLTPGLTGLFLFPDGDRMVFILGTHRALSVAGPYNLEPYEFAIHVDLDSRISFTDAEDRARYGGTVVDPTAISPEVTLAFRLNDDATLHEQRFEGLRSTEDIQIYTGVRDDPFIFPRFFGTNIIAIVVSIPRAAFPANQRDWLLWATTTEVDGGDQLDHVGRSNRTQLARFDFLNTLAPSEHVAAIQEMHDKRERISKYLGQLSPPLQNGFNTMFPIRHYDFQPDVMVFTSRYPPGYPNGRLLPDDVVLLTCQIGECLLMEAAFTDTEEWPRQTVNDKEFLAGFPYLAEPWPAKEPKPQGFRWGLWITILVVLVVIVVILLIGCLLCRWISSRRAKRPAPAAA
jgi:hypothetical protein